MCTFVLPNWKTVLLSPNRLENSSPPLEVALIHGLKDLVTGGELWEGSDRHVIFLTQDEQDEQGR